MKYVKAQLNQIIKTVFIKNIHINIICTYSVIYAIIFIPFSKFKKIFILGKGRDELPYYLCFVRVSSGNEIDHL